MEKNNLHNIGSGDKFNEGDVLALLDKNASLYTVTSHYFDNLADDILEKIHTSDLSRQLAYGIPKDYFSDFAGNLLKRIKDEELMNEVADDGVDQGDWSSETPLLNGLSKKEVYQVPVGYFDQFSEKLSNHFSSDITNEIPDAPLVPIYGRRRVWRTVAAAAAVIGILFSGEWYFNHGDNKVIPQSSNQYAQTIESASDSFQNDLSDLSEDEIKAYLNTVESSSKGDSVSSNAANATQKAIRVMSNDELESYLNRTPTTY